MFGWCWSWNGLLWETTPHAFRDLHRVYTYVSLLSAPSPPIIPFSSVGLKLPCHLLLWQVERVC